jgi:hypothetical protein
MRNNITLLLLLFLYTTAFSQERLIKILRQQYLTSGSYVTMGMDRFVYDQQGRIYKTHTTSYDTTGVTLTGDQYQTTVFNIDGGVDSLLYTAYNPQTGDLISNTICKYYYTGNLLDSIYVLSNGASSDAVKYTYDNGLMSEQNNYTYSPLNGWYVNTNFLYFYDVNNNMSKYEVREGYYYDTTYVFDTLSTKFYYYYNNDGLLDSLYYVDRNFGNNVEPHHIEARSYYKYTGADSLRRKEQFTYQANGDIWNGPWVDAYYYDNDNFLSLWMSFNLNDSIQGNNMAYNYYIRSLNGRLDTLNSYYFQNNTLSGYLGRAIYIYSSDPGEINSITQIDACAVAVYPNPFNGFFTIETDNKEKKNILVFDMNGKVISNTTTTDKNYVYDARALHAGMYMVSVATNKGTVVKTIIKGQ